MLATPDSESLFDHYADLINVLVTSKGLEESAGEEASFE